MAKGKKLIYWSVVVAAMVFFAGFGLWMGVATGQAQCVKFKLAIGDSNSNFCGAGWVEVDRVPSGGGWFINLCAIQ
jgi:hypothetical protein